MTRPERVRVAASALALVLVLPLSLVPSAAGVAPLPVPEVFEQATPLTRSTLVNGGFEHGLTGWLPGNDRPCVTCAVVPGGALGSAQALSVPNYDERGNFVQQVFPTPDGAAYLLTFHAKVTGRADAVAEQIVLVRGHPEPFLHDLTLGVAFTAETVRLYAGSWHHQVVAPVDLTGDWHRIEALVVPALGHAVLHIDGEAVAAVRGEPFTLPAEQRLILGDASGKPPWMAQNPDAAYDEVAFGPVDLAVGAAPPRDAPDLRDGGVPEPWNDWDLVCVSYVVSFVLSTGPYPGMVDDLLDCL